MGYPENDMIWGFQGHRLRLGLGLRQQQISNTTWIRTLWVPSSFKIDLSFITPHRQKDRQITTILCTSKLTLMTTMMHFLTKPQYSFAQSNRFVKKHKSQRGIAINTSPRWKRRLVERVSGRLDSVACWWSHLPNRPRWNGETAAGHPASGARRRRCISNCNGRTLAAEAARGRPPAVQLDTRTH